MDLDNSYERVIINKLKEQLIDRAVKMWNISGKFHETLKIIQIGKLS